MRANELLSKRMMELLEKDGNIDPNIAMEQVNKEAHEEGTALYKLLSLYQDLEDVDTAKEYISISSKILEISPQDYEILAQREIYLNKSVKEAIEKIKIILEECTNDLKSKFNYVLGEDDAYCFIPARDYLRGVHQLGVLYREIENEEKAIECYKKILELNPRDNLGVRASLAPYYFENDINEFKNLASKFNNSLETMILDLVVTIEEGKDYKEKLENLVEANRFAAFCLSGVYDFTDEFIERSVGSYYQLGSFEEFAYVMLAYDRELKKDGFTRIADAFASLNQEMKNYSPFKDEEVVLLVGFVELSQEVKKFEFKDSYLFRVINGDDTLSQKVQMVGLFDSSICNDKKEFENFLMEMKEKHLISYDSHKVRISIGGLVIAYTIANMNEDEGQNDDIIN